jgi:predicted phosphodiesterase
VKIYPRLLPRTRLGRSGRSFRRDLFVVRQKRCRSLARRFYCPFTVAALIRIFSDIHYGDRMSTVRSLGQLRPLLADVDRVILNGDTIDTRIGPHAAATARDLAAVTEFFNRSSGPVTFVTGNHDPDISPHHAIDLADGRVFVTHGDIIFENIVPWSRDAATISDRIHAGLAQMPESERQQLEPRLQLFRRVCASIPQRHQAEPNPFKHALRLAADTMWPPSRALSILQAWRETPERAAAITAVHRPAAKFALIGHLHQPGCWTTRSGVTVINTGSFSRPFGAWAVDIGDDRLVVRRVVPRRGEFHPGRIVAEFPL